MKCVINNFFKVFLLSIFFFTIACSQDDPTQNTPVGTVLTGSYLGQEAPGLQAERFPPEGFLANSDWFWHGPLSFSPDGTELYMTKYLDGDQMQLNWAKVENNNWTHLQTAPFAESVDENNPFVYVDGSKLFFIANRTGNHFWVSNRIATGWSNPEAINIPSPEGGSYGWQMSVARDQSIYFDFMAANGFVVYVSRYVDGVYQAPEILPDNINNGEAFCPFIDPDEEYLIFSSRRDGSLGGFDLFISFKDDNGTWLDPINMGSAINSSREEFAPYVTIDGNYLFFFSARGGENYNPYWVSSQVIDDLR